MNGSAVQCLMHRDLLMRRSQLPIDDFVPEPTARWVCVVNLKNDCHYFIYIRRYS